ncbi:MAG: RecQ family ATP-dependent DNA helicase [bacterium]|nr:RecQ family ATP-dependent DNA helicase [bacterium]
MPDPKMILRETFGLREFRPGQEAVITALIEGRSALAVFPTGGGKSLCYQLPALVFTGLTLVISPLIALMKDQVDSLCRKGVAAARLDSTMDVGAAGDIYARLNSGTLKILYVAPERLGNERFLERLRRQRISLLAVDEAHCISEWGHNFRPDYLKIARQAKVLQVERILALTATATPVVAKDICKAFAIGSADHIHTGFYRPNLRLKVTPCSQEERLGVLCDQMKMATGPAVVYVTLQRTAESVADALIEAGIRAKAYHAGLKDDVRAEVQESFMSGHLAVVVATIAFGMGIDKADIRAIYHYNLPKTLENYVQEIGRAGRDGKPSVCELLACADDCVTLGNFTYGDTPTEESLRDLVAYLMGLGETFDVSYYDLSVQFDIRSLVIATLLTYLELNGVLRATGPFYSAYKYRMKRPVTEILGPYDADRQTFLKAVFDLSSKGRIWDHLDPARAAEELGEPRERILAALGHLEERGDLEVEPSGLRQRFQLLATPTGDELSKNMAQTFRQREGQDITRLNQVVAFAEHGGCLTRHLLAYFGEDIGHDCGHCDACEHPGSRQLPRSPVEAFGDSHRKTVEGIRAENHIALAHPRQLARFLCGLTSPAASRARLARHKAFAVWARLPFSEVLRFVEQI